MRPAFRLLTLTAAAVCVLGLSSVSAEACSVCFTGDDTNTTNAVNGMIIAMLAPLGLVMLGIGAVVVHFAKRSRMPLPEHEVLRRALLNDEKTLLHHD